mmetsp:Transcript_20735/g.71559  ORF Transcript_20735/g.71559 Transcript_20735/m.71559 type:complete len:81 (+) Transcript_20735:363-605(+)
MTQLSTSAVGNLSASSLTDLGDHESTGGGKRGRVNSHGSHADGIPRTASNGGLGALHSFDDGLLYDDALYFDEPTDDMGR